MLPTLAGPIPDHATQLLPSVGADMHNIARLPAPRDIPLSAPGVPSSSLDFLADISAHHGRTEPDLHSMMVDEQQPYFGWSEGTPADQAAQRNIMSFDSSSNDMLQLWLEPRADSASNFGSLGGMRDGHFSELNDSLTVTAHPHSPHSIEIGKNSGENIPNERFSRVQRCWLVPLNHTGRVMNSLWRDIAYTDLENLFSATFHPPRNPNLISGSRWGVDEDCRRRMQAAFSQTPFSYSMHSPRNDAVSPGALGNFPPAEILDMALDIFFRTFHPLVPFVHLPTFSAKETRLPLLYVMCLIGMMMLGTKGTTVFVARNFTVG